MASGGIDAASSLPRSGVAGAGRAAIVTGGGAGIGLAVARALAADGIRILIVDRDADAAKAAARSLIEACGAAAPLRADIGVAADVGTLVEGALAAFGRLDILVNNAGIGDLAPFLETSLEQWERVLRVNLTGTFLCGQAAARHMAKQGRGRIVNIASISGMLAGINRTAYGTTKAAIIHLTRQMALELGPLGITVNAVAPGPIETALARRSHSDGTRAAYLDRIPLHRYGLAEEVAGAVRYLCSDAAAYVNGQVLAVDGGFVISGINAADVG